MLFGSGGDGHGNLMTKTATENGVYTAAEEIDPETGEIFDPPKDGYSVFTVDLALDDKSVSLTTSQITGSQTAVFEYDPHDENPELEGYSLFTIDLSDVKDDIEDLQQQLDDCHDCWEDVVEALQQYDPDYDPDEGECPASKVEDLVDDYETVKEEAEECSQCKSAVIAAIQAILPNFDPQTCQDMVDAIEDVYKKGEEDAPEKYTFEPDPNDPDHYPKIADVVGNDELTDEDLHIVIRAVDDRDPPIPAGEHNVYYGFYDSVTGTFIDRTSAHQYSIDPDHTDYVASFRVIDPTTGTYTYDWVNWEYLYNPPEWGWVHHTYTETNQNLISYGDPSHTYTVTKG